MATPLPSFTTEVLDRMCLAVQLVEGQLHQSSALLSKAGVPHLLIGGYGVKLWIDSVDSSASRFTPNVDYLIREDDAGSVIKALADWGFNPMMENWRIQLRDPEKPQSRNSIRFLFAGKKPSEEALFPLPDLESPVMLEGIPCLSLVPLVLMKLATYRTIDSVHIQDMTHADLVNADWFDILPAVLKSRLERILENPHL